MTALSTRMVSVREYLSLDRQSELHYELDDGVLIPIEAASYFHCVISSNLVGEIRNRIKDGPCRVHSNVLRVATTVGRRYCYPDVVIVCGEPELEDRHGDTLLNPKIIMEIISDSTEHRDRGRKFRLYRGVESLQQYVLITQDLALIEVYQRDTENYWRFFDVAGLDSALPLPSLECSIALSEIYGGVTFPEVIEDDEDLPL